MNAPQNTKEEMLFRAERLLFYTDLLIKQCDGWLAEEEGEGTKARRREGTKEEIWGSLYRNKYN